MSGTGFGDSLDASEVLANYEGWLHSRAHSMVQGTQVRANGEDHDDLVQHGLVAMWKALGTHNPAKGALPSWLTLKANGAMLDSLRPRDKHLALAAMPEPDGHLPEQFVDEPDLLLALTRAYHRGEVSQALDTLTPRQREYVRLRFWEGKQHTAMVAHFGYDPTGLWNAKGTGAKARLRVALAHLMDAA